MLLYIVGEVDGADALILTIYFDTTVDLHK